MFYIFARLREHVDHALKRNAEAAERVLSLISSPPPARATVHDNISRREQLSGNGRRFPDLHC
jgi:hypothetical protein